MASEFITLTGASGAPALIRVSAIVSVVQDVECPEWRVIQYVAGDKLLTMHVEDTVDAILLNMVRPPMADWSGYIAERVKEVTTQAD